jgi:hypothetical protein
VLADLRRTRAVQLEAELHLLFAQPTQDSL